jgi:hypothetical protein
MIFIPIHFHQAQFLVDFEDLGCDLSMIVLWRKKSFVEQCHPIILPRICKRWFKKIFFKLLYHRPSASDILSDLLYDIRTPNYNTIDANDSIASTEMDAEYVQIVLIFWTQIYGL